MTRAERRREERELANANKTYNMTAGSLAKSLDEARKEERKRMSDFMVKYYSAAIAIVLRDKWGFGTERLTRIIGQINDMYDSILEGYVNIDDIRQTILDETGIDLR